MGQSTLVKVVQYIVFENDVSDLLVENLIDDIAPEIHLDSGNGELIVGEIMESYIENIVIMNENESEDDEIELMSVPRQFHESYMNLNDKQLRLNDLIQLQDDSLELYSLVRLNGQIFLCHYETRNCIHSDEALRSLNDVESILMRKYPSHRVYRKITEK